MDKLEEEFKKLFGMFMKPEIQYDERGFVLVESMTTSVLSMEEYMDEVKRQWPDLQSMDAEPVGCYRGRLHAPGYLDCTDWVFGYSENDVKELLVDMYGEE